MMVSSVFVALFVAPPVAWPPAAPVVTLDEHVLVDAQLRPVEVAPAAMCARETHTVADNDCRITRMDGGPSGFVVVGGSGQRCDVGLDAPPRERRWVFGEEGRLREEIAIDKRTSRAGGQMYRWQDDRLLRIEHWYDFKSGSPTSVESFVYDEDGHVIEYATQAPPGSPQRFIHAWHDGKIRTATAVGSGTMWSYDYKGDRLLSVRERLAPGSATGPVVETRYAYDRDGRLASEERLVGDERLAWTGWSYDKKGRPVSRATDDRGQAPAESALGPTGAEVASLAQRPDGNWDRTTRYYYDCAWIAAGEANPTVDADTTSAHESASAHESISEQRSETIPSEQPLPAPDPGPAAVPAPALVPAEPPSP